MADRHQSKQNDNKKTTDVVQRLEDDNQQEQQQVIPDMGGLLQRMHSAPSSLTPNNVLQLQRLVGNQAVGQVLGRGKSIQRANIDGVIQRKPLSVPWHPTQPAKSGSLVQPSHEPVFAKFLQRMQEQKNQSTDVPAIQRDGLRVGPANDKYEEEAEETANTIMRMPRSPVTVHRKPINQISRYKANRITTSKQTRNVIQPARGKWGRFLGSLGTLPLPGIGDLSARLTFGFEKGRKKITKPNHTSNRYIIQNISITSTEIGGNDNFVLRGRKYIPADYSLESGTKKGLTKAIILLSGSGGSNEDQLQPVAKQYTEQGSTVYAVNYRGYGNSKDRKRRRDGTYNESMPYLSEQGLYDDAQRIYDYVRRDGFSSKQIVIHGYSLGGAVAAHLAKKVAKTEQLGGLVLHSSIRSSYKAARGGLGWLKYFGLAQLGGLYTRMSAGSFGTVSHLKKLAERDSNIPIHFMSGSKGDGDQLSLGETELDEEAGKMGFQNLTSHEGPGSHLRTSNHLDHPTWNALGDLLSVQRKAEDETPTRQTNQLHTLQRDGGDGSFDTSDEFTNKVNSSKGGGSPLPSDIQADFGSKIGADLSGVRVHTGGESAKLNQQIQAKAFTHGNDIHFGSGQYNPGSSEGKRLIAHEVTHTVQQGASPVQRTVSKPSHNQKIDTGVINVQRITSDVVQRQFNPARTNSKTHLRVNGSGGRKIGPNIANSSLVLVDNNDSNRKKQTHTHWIGDDTYSYWRPAVNIAPTSQQGNINNNRKGYIRDSKIGTTGTSFETVLRGRIVGFLTAQERRYPALANQLNKDNHVDFLFTKALRYTTWNPDNPTLETFFDGLNSKEAKMTRIQEGAEYVADSIEHWRRWLHPTQARKVKISNVKFMESDLHEKGLGVMKVTFTKPKGPEDSMFADKTQLTTFIKPEDKSLEKKLLGYGPDSTASKINKIVGLEDSDKALTTIKMEADERFGTIVEKAAGKAAEDIGEFEDKPIKQTFHETLVFAFLAGIDDLHRENVFWHEGKPYLIDADNVLSYNQMINKDNGAMTQSGFGDDYDNEAAKANMEAIKNLDNTKIQSEILDAMINDRVKRGKIIQAIKEAIAGEKGRVVPIRTSMWGRMLKFYPKASLNAKNDILDQASQKEALVREGKKFEPLYGPGLYGTSSKNISSEFYSQVSERAQLKHDFDTGVIPFYEYEYDTGYVTHNGQKIYHGQTLDQAMQIMVNKFS